MERTSGSTSSTDAARAPAAVRERVSLGQVVGAHGLRGELRVRLADADTDNLAPASRIELGRDLEDPRPVAYEVARVGAGRRGEARVALVGVEDRDAAEALRGCVVLGRAEELEACAPGEYYAYELVGCRVEDAEGRPVGRIDHIWETGAQDVLGIAAEGGGQHLVPARLILEVDVEARRVVIDALPGLLEA